MIYINKKILIYYLINEANNSLKNEKLYGCAGLLLAATNEKYKQLGCYDIDIWGRINKVYEYLIKNGRNY